MCVCLSVYYQSVCMFVLYLSVFVHLLLFDFLAFLFVCPSAVMMWIVDKMSR